MLMNEEDREEERMGMDVAKRPAPSSLSSVSDDDSEGDSGGTVYEEVHRLFPIRNVLLLIANFVGIMVLVAICLDTYVEVSTAKDYLSSQVEAIGDNLHKRLTLFLSIAAPSLLTWVDPQEDNSARNSNNSSSIHYSNNQQVNYSHQSSSLEDIRLHHNMSDPSSANTMLHVDTGIPGIGNDGMAFGIGNLPATSIKAVLGAQRIIPLLSHKIDQYMDAAATTPTDSSNKDHSNTVSDWKSTVNLMNSILQFVSEVVGGVQVDPDIVQRYAPSSVGGGLLDIDALVTMLHNQFTHARYQDMGTMINDAVTQLTLLNFVALSYEAYGEGYSGPKTVSFDINEQAATPLMLMKFAADTFTAMPQLDFPSTPAPPTSAPATNSGSAITTLDTYYAAGGASVFLLLVIAVGVVSWRFTKTRRAQRMRQEMLTEKKQEDPLLGGERKGDSDVVATAKFLYGSKYQALSELGRGAFGTVFLVAKVLPKQNSSEVPSSREVSGEQFAMKVVVCRGDDGIITAINEFRALRALQHHPNVTKLVDMFMSWEAGPEVGFGSSPPGQSTLVSKDITDSGDEKEYLTAVGTTEYGGGSESVFRSRFLCLVMHYYKEGTLEAGMKKKAHYFANSSVITSAIAQIVSGLEFSHIKKIIHRDLKPGNVLLDNDSLNFVITDFGMARDLEQTCTTRGGGTMYFLAPEQIDHHVSTKSDIWAVGCIAVLMASAGKGKKDTRAIFMRRMSPGFEQAMLSHELSHLPQWLSSLILKMLSLDSKVRPSARDVMDEIDEQFENEHVVSIDKFIPEDDDDDDDDDDDEKREYEQDKEKRVSSTGSPTEMTGNSVNSMTACTANKVKDALAQCLLERRDRIEEYDLEGVSIFDD